MAQIPGKMRINGKSLWHLLAARSERGDESHLSDFVPLPPFFLGRVLVRSSLLIINVLTIYLLEGWIRTLTLRVYRWLGLTMIFILLSHLEALRLSLFSGHRTRLTFCLAYPFCSLCSPLHVPYHSPYIQNDRGGQMDFILRVYLKERKTEEPLHLLDGMVESSACSCHLSS